MRQLDEFEKVKLVDHYMGHLARCAQDYRAKGWFDHANYFAEVLHQFECGNILRIGEFRSLDGLLVEDLIRNQPCREK